MAADLGLDSRVEALEGATDAGRWYDALLALCNAGMRSDRNPFGAAAKIAATVAETPVGMVTRWSGAADSVPDGWLALDGQAVSKTEYAALFAKVGSTFGETATTFNLPDTRRRVAVGRGGVKPAGSAGPGAALGDTGGAETVTLSAGQMARHGHGLDLSLASAGAHRHQVYQTLRTNNNEDLNTNHRVVARQDNPSSSASLDSAGAHTHRVSGNVAYAGSATPTPVALASKTVVMTYIVKA